MTTSKHSTGDLFEEELTSSQPAFPVSRQATQAEERERRMTAGSGRKLLESLSRLARASEFSKMFMDCLVSKAVWYSTKCSLTWRLRATKSHRLYFQLAVSTRRTDGTEFGLLLTVTANGADRNTNFAQGGTALKVGLQKQGLILTPKASDGQKGTRTLSGALQERKRRKNGTDLPTAAVLGLLPTPSAGNQHSGGYITEWGGSGNPLRKITGKTSRLNPRFVEEMMGYPIGFTELEDSETQLCPRWYMKYLKQYNISTMNYKAVKGFEGFYEVSDSGIVRSVDRTITVVNHGKECQRTDKGKLIRPTLKRNGYLQVGLIMSGKRTHINVHRLVAIAFVPNPNNLPEVNHIDGDKQNNTASNLEWCTSKENHAHAKEKGLAHYSDGRNGFSKEVINTVTGEEFETARMAYNNFKPDYGYIYFTRKLSGEKPNDTPFQYKSPTKSSRQSKK